MRYCGVMEPRTPSTIATDLLEAANGDVERAISEVRKAHLAMRPVQTNSRPASTEVILRVQDVAKHYKVGKNRVEALKGVTIEIHKGEFVALTGTSGSGKSTLLQLMGGLDKPSSGIIEVQGQNLAKLSDAKLSRFRNQSIGFVFQFFYLQPFLSLQTNVEVPAIFARTKPKDRAPRSTELTNTVGLGDRLKHLPRELSGGQMQRAAIARALQNKPSILLADEPTGNLDRSNALAIFELFQKVRDEQGTTVIVVTHDLELAAMADRTIMMSDGVIT